MRILFRHLSGYGGADGAAASMRKLLGAYCQRFPQDFLTVICGYHSPMSDLQRFDNCRVIPAPKRVPRELYRLFWGFVGVYADLKRYEADVMWCVNLGSYVPRRVPQVVSVNNAYQVYPTKEVAGLHPESPLHVLALRYFSWLSLRRSASAIVETELMAKYLKGISGCPDYVAVLPKAVESEGRVDERPLAGKVADAIAQASDTTKLLYAATAVPHKNHKVLAGMMEILRAKKVAAKLFVTLKASEWNAVAGSGAERLVESGQVVPIGWVPKDELAELYRACDICVMPSLLESLSSATLEAMWWLRPQVASNLPYATDLCGTAALYADPHDPASWAALVEELIADRELRARLVAAGAKRAEMLPKSWTEMAEHVRNVLATVVERSGARSGKFPKRVSATIAD